MILRRFMQHVDEQNWFAVWIDVVVVVVGIFLGLQVTDWNDMRKGREVEKRYIERLVESTERNISTLDGAISTNQSLLVNQLDVYRIQTTKSLSTDEESRLRKQMVAMAFWRAVTLDSGLLDTLTTSGDLTMIRNETIQDQITELRAGIRDLDRQLDYYRGWWLEILNVELLEGKLIASIEPGGNVFSGGLTPDEVQRSLNHYALSADIQTLQSDRMISNSAAMLGPRTNFLGSLKGLRDDFESFRATLAEETSSW